MNVPVSSALIWRRSCRMLVIITFIWTVWAGCDTTICVISSLWRKHVLFGIWGCTCVFIEDKFRQGSANGWAHRFCLPFALFFYTWAPDVSDDGKVSAVLALLLFHISGCVFLFSAFFRLSAFVCACYEYLTTSLSLQSFFILLKG